MIRHTLLTVGFLTALGAGTAMTVAADAQDNAGASVQQQPRGPRGGGAGGPRQFDQRGPERRGFGIPGVELTDAQREQARAIAEANRSELSSAGQKLREAQRAFAAAVEGATVDEAAIKAASTTLAGALADEAIVRAKVRSEIAALLTPQQQQQAAARRDERRKRGEERRQGLRQRLERLF